MRENWTRFKWEHSGIVELSDAPLVPELYISGEVQPTALQLFFEWSGGPSAPVGKPKVIWFLCLERGGHFSNWEFEVAGVKVPSWIEDIVARATPGFEAS